MKRLNLRLVVCCVACFVVAIAGPFASAADPTEDDYYRIVEIPIPPDITLEVGALEWMPDGQLAVSTRRGDIYFVENTLSQSLDDVTFKKFASGLHQVFGLSQLDGVLYATQRPEITRVIDTDGDGEADLFETVSDAWGTAGANYD